VRACICIWADPPYVEEHDDSQVHGCGEHGGRHMSVTVRSARGVVREEAEGGGRRRAYWLASAKWNEIVSRSTHDRRRSLLERSTAHVSDTRSKAPRYTKRRTSADSCRGRVGGGVARAGRSDPRRQNEVSGR
jgi:hypothetical protein